MELATGNCMEYNQLRELHTRHRSTQVVAGFCGRAVWADGEAARGDMPRPPRGGGSRPWPASRSLVSVEEIRVKSLEGDRVAIVCIVFFCALAGRRLLVTYSKVTGLAWRILCGCCVHR